MMGRKCPTLMVLCQFATGIFLRLSIFKKSRGKSAARRLSYSEFFFAG
tara:strand:- start:2701 stop:2844 length:144 start_codon:yes stop_codon:yes gene_type:complete